MADDLADLVEHATVDGPPEDGSASLESGRAMLRAVMCQQWPRRMSWRTHELAVDQEPPTSPWRANALWLLGAAHLHAGDPAAAEATFSQAVDTSQRSGATVMVSRRLPRVAGSRAR